MKEYRFLRAAARLLVGAVDMFHGYIGRELMRVAIIAIVTIPACWLGLMLAVLTA